MTNHNNDCSLLNAYLLGDLAADGRARFEAHLASCEACREAVAQDRHVYGLLSSVQLAAPPRLFQRVERRIEREQFVRRVRRTGLLAMAASLLLAVTWYSRHPHPGAEPTMARRASDVINRAPPPVVHVEIAPESHLLAVPLKSNNPRVTIIWLYPEVRLADADTGSSPGGN